MERWVKAVWYGGNLKWLRRRMRWRRWAGNPWTHCPSSSDLHFIYFFFAFEVKEKDGRRRREREPEFKSTHISNPILIYYVEKAMGFFPIIDLNCICIFFGTSFYTLSRHHFLSLLREREGGKKREENPPWATNTKSFHLFISRSWACGKKKEMTA